MTKTPPTKIEDMIMSIRLKKSILMSKPFKTKTPAKAIAKLTHCQKLIFSFKNKKAMKAPNIGLEYLIDIAEPKGILWITMKKVAKEANPINALKTKIFRCVPKIGTCL